MIYQDLNLGVSNTNLLDIVIYLQVHDPFYAVKLVNFLHHMHGRFLQYTLCRRFRGCLAVNNLGSMGDVADVSML